MVEGGLYLPFEVAAHLGISTSWVKRAVAAETVETESFNGRIRFDPAKRSEWLDAILPTELSHLPTAGVVYFVAPEKRKGPIKIGTALDPVQRLRDLQAASPSRLQILATRPGGQRLEAELHIRFAADRLHGEWFRPSETLDLVIAECLCVPRASELEADLARSLG